MRHCPRCNELLSDDSNTCPRCGKFVSERELSKTKRIALGFNIFLIAAAVVALKLLYPYTLDIYSDAKPFLDVFEEPTTSMGAQLRLVFAAIILSLFAFFIGLSLFRKFR